MQRLPGRHARAACAGRARAAQRGQAAGLPRHAGQLDGAHGHRARRRRHARHHGRRYSRYARLLRVIMGRPRLVGSHGLLASRRACSCAGQLDRAPGHLTPPVIGGTTPGARLCCVSANTCFHCDARWWQAAPHPAAMLVGTSGVVPGARLRCTTCSWAAAAPPALAGSCSPGA